MRCQIALYPGRLRQKCEKFCFRGGGVLPSYTIWKQISEEDAARNLPCYTGVYNKPLVTLTLPFDLGGWIVQLAPLLVMDGNKTKIVDRNVLLKTGLQLQHEKSTNQMLICLHVPVMLICTHKKLIG